MSASAGMDLIYLSTWRARLSWKHNENAGPSGTLEVAQPRAFLSFPDLNARQLICCSKFSGASGSECTRASKRHDEKARLQMREVS